MARPPLEVADVFRGYAGAFLKALGGAVSSAKERVLRELVACRTAVLGGHVDRCDQCDHERVAYNSCRNRHCPKCQAAARAEWFEAREADLLPVEYFHVVFTVPPAIADVALQNKKVLYGILLRASAETLHQIAADPAHLGAEIGFLSILHTWGQTLLHHPHVHCVVPGGGLSPDRSRWVACKPGFFLPVRVLAAVFRGKFLDMTKRAFAQGDLIFQGRLGHLDDPVEFAAYLQRSYENNWVVYAKQPFGGPKQVLKYLARYTHRVAIANHRLISLNDGQVSFRYKDYAHGNRPKTMKLDATEFIRRFLLHVLPRRFVRIRHYGLLSNQSRASKLPLCRLLLGVWSTDGPVEPASDDCTVARDDGDATRCPACRKGRLIRSKIHRLRPDLACALEPQVIDSS